MNKNYCKDCVRWYITKVDQCEIPACGIDCDDSFDKAIDCQKSKVDKMGQEFIKSHLSRIHFSTSKKIYGMPSLLNKNNDCYFYKALPTYLKWLTNIVRMFY